jgi:hypothetical protein
MSESNFHQIFENTFNSIIYNEWYYVAILINFLFMYKVLIKPIIKQKVLYGRELCLIISWGYLAFVPILNQALAIVFSVYGLVKGLDSIEKSKVFDFRNKDDH